MTISNDLRIRVLEGEDITAEEMLLIVNEIRQGRRAAVRSPAATKPARQSTTKPNWSTEDLKAILNQDLG